MKKIYQKENRILKIVITIATIIAIMLVCALAVFMAAWQQEYGEETRENKQENKQNRIVIEVPEESTKGTVRVFDYDGCCIYAYYGEIEIRNDGKNGEEIDIICAGYLEAYEQQREREGDK